MTLSFYSTNLTNSLLLDAIYFRKLYDLPKLRRFILLWRPRNDLELVTYIDQYIILMLMFSQGILTTFFLKKKTYKDNEATIELICLGIQTITFWGKYKKNKNSSLVHWSWFLYNVKRFFIFRSRFDLS